MSLGVWEPGIEKPAGPSLELVQRFAAVEISDDTLDRQALSAAGVEGDSSVMKLGADAWALAEALDSATIIHLVRVFTLVEVLPGWDSGSKSPVIGLVKILKSRGEFEADLRKWIKLTSDNRYLPYGSAL